MSQSQCRHSVEWSCSRFAECSRFVARTAVAGRDGFSKKTLARIAVDNQSDDSEKSKLKTGFAAGNSKLTCCPGIIIICQLVCC